MSVNFIQGWMFWVVGFAGRDDGEAGGNRKCFSHAYQKMDTSKWYQDIPTAFYK